jgi:hypothetical protein
MRDVQGRFLPGVDPDRHTFTREERRRGYRRLLAGCRNNDVPIHTIAWVWRRIRGYYRQLRRDFQ